MILCSSHLCSIYVVYDIGGPLLHSWGKSHLIMVDNVFNTLLDLVWQYFVKVFFFFKSVFIMDIGLNWFSFLSFIDLVFVVCVCMLSCFSLV